MAAVPAHWEALFNHWRDSRPAGPLAVNSEKVYRAMWRSLGRALPLDQTPPAELTENQWLTALEALHLDLQPRRRYLQLAVHVLGPDSVARALLEQDLPPPRRLPAVLPNYQTQQLQGALRQCTMRQQLLVCLVLGGGLRAGEVAQVRWGDLLLDQTPPWLVARSKTGQPNRSTPLAPWAVELMNELLAPLRQVRGALPPDDLIFHNEQGLPLAASTLWRDCRAVVHKALGDTRHLGLTRLRNTFGVRNLAYGTPLPEVQEWLGHQTEDTTARLLPFVAPKHGAV